MGRGFWIRTARTAFEVVLVPVVAVAAASVIVAGMAACLLAVPFVAAARSAREIRKLWS